MKNKKVLLSIFCIVGGSIGYYFSNYLNLNFKLILYIIGLIATTFYIVESVKNKYGKASIVVSVWAMILFTVLSIYEFILSNLPKFSMYKNYLVALLGILVFPMVIVAGMYVIKKGNKRDSISFKILFVIIALCVTFVIIVTLLQNLGLIS